MTSGNPAPRKSKGAATSRKGMKQHGTADRKIGPDARQEAFRLMVEGVPLAAIARRLRVKAHTIAAWRDSEEGLTALKTLRAARAVDLGAALKNARTQLETALPRSVQVLTDLLDSSDPKVRMRAAMQILDRAGVPRTEVVESHGTEADLSQLTPEELDVARALYAKASRGAA